MILKDLEKVKYALAQERQETRDMLRVYKKFTVAKPVKKK